MTTPEENLPSEQAAREHRQMAPIAAVMYACAGTVVGLSLLLPHSPEMNRTALLAAALVGPLAAVGIWLLRKHLPPWFFHITTAAGTVIAGLCIYWSGDASSSLRVPLALGRGLQRLLLLTDRTGRPAWPSRRRSMPSFSRRIPSPTTTSRRTGSSRGSASRLRARSSRRWSTRAVASRTSASACSPTRSSSRAPTR